MKYNYSKAVMTGVLVMALATGGTVMADTIRAEQDVNNKVSLVITDEGKTDETGNISLQPADEAQKASGEGTTDNGYTLNQDQKASGEGTTDNSTALNDALQALENARKNERLQKLEEELKGYVDAGSLTQEQADLILENAKEHQTRGLNRNKGEGSARDQMTDPSNESRKGKRQGMRGPQNQQPQNQQPQNQQPQKRQPQNRQPGMFYEYTTGTVVM